MSEENLVRQCAPTLAGIKTGTIFPAPFTSLAELTAEIRELNRILVYLDIWKPKVSGICH